MSYLQSDEELARLQKLSNDYQPEVSGPLVGELQSTIAITTEYENGDPIQRQKTAALPHKYATFRKCRGDGHCGWRAIAYTYFESLLHHGNKNQLLEEEARLRSLANLINAVGHQEDLWIDFAQEMFDLLRETSNNLTSPHAEADLLAAFNDEPRAMAIITYLKLLTSAWMQTHANDYAPFLEGIDIQTYCSINIEPAVCEIEHLGVCALTDVLVKPAGFALEILYLDRTPGEEVNLYRFDPVSTDGQVIPNAPTLRLLYRPGHYDILYKAQELPGGMINAPVAMATPVYMSHSNDYGSVGFPNHGCLTQIPGMSYPGYGPMGFISTDYMPEAMELPIQPTPSVPISPVAAVAPPQSYAVISHSAPHAIPNASDYIDAGISQLPHHPALERTSGPFRQSTYQLKSEMARSPSHDQFQTAIFRNSHFNTAHFMNPDFQPEEWRPDAAEYATPSFSTRQSKRSIH